MNLQRVQVFSLGAPKPGTPKERRRYSVRWRVDGRDRMRSFRTKAEAERLRSQLQVEATAGTPFDLATGMPAPWVRRSVTWWAWSREWLELKWPQWSGNSRRTGVESLVAFTTHLVHRSASPPEGLGDWLRTVGFVPGVEIDPKDPFVRWLNKWSVPLDAITPGLLERTLTLATMKRDGSPASPPVVRRRRTTLNAVLRAAVRRGLLDSNPMERVEWKAPGRPLEVDVALVPGPDDIAAVVEAAAALTTSGAKYGALFACVGYAGLRPSEALGLRVGDLDLPRAGWGLARLHGAVTSPGARYTADGSTTERKALKHRSVGAVREVPLPTPLVEALRGHVERFPPVDDRVFSSDAGNPLTTASYTKVWNRVRRSVWAADDPLADCRVYDLRHGAATMMLRAGVMPAEVARRLGHSVDVLNRVYAGVVDGERERSNALIESMLAEEG